MSKIADSIRPIITIAIMGIVGITMIVIAKRDLFIGMILGLLQKLFLLPLR